MSIIVPPIQFILQLAKESYEMKFLILLSVISLSLGGKLPSSPASGEIFTGKDSGARGIVNPVYRCGGVGTFVQLRVSDCVGRCQFTPGTVYNAELDFMPSSSAPGLSLKVEVCPGSGFCHQIIDVPLPGSSVQPGMVYTSKYSLVPNDILSGTTVEFKAYLSHSDNALLEICVYSYVDILFPTG